MDRSLEGQTATSFRDLTMKWLRSAGRGSAYVILTIPALFLGTMQKLIEDGRYSRRFQMTHPEVLPSVVNPLPLSW